MAGQNDVTGDVLINKIGDKKAFDEGFDRIFGKKEKTDCDSHQCDGCFICDCETEKEKKENVGTR